MASALIIGKRGEGTPLAIRLSEEGHIVKVHSQQRVERLNGFVNPSTVGVPKLLDQYDVILFDSPGSGSMAEEMQKSKPFIFGSHPVCDRLVEDDEYKRKVAARLLKVSIQTDIPEGVKLDVEGWFNGSRFVCYNHSLNYERLMEGDIGPVTNTMGCVCWVAAVEGNEIIARAMQPLEELLTIMKYIGPFSVRLVVTEKDLFFVDFLPGFQYDRIQAWTELMKTPLFDFLWQIACGNDHLCLRDEYSVSVRLVAPPYLRLDVETLKGIQVMNVPEPAKKHVFLSDVMRAHQNEDEVLAGDDGIVGCVTARGSSIQELRRRVYRTVQNSVISKDVMYRKDIGSGVEESIERLKEWGWLSA